VYNPNVTIAANQTSAYPPPVGKVTNGIGNARTTITAYEEASRYTLATASYLEDMYRKWESPDCGPVVGWNRQVIYLRPARAVVFDRTNVCNASYKQMMAWHTPAVPTKIPGPYSLRYDVSYGGSFVGSMFFVTPFGVQVATKDLDGEGLVYRTEVTAQNNTTDNNWLTVFDLSNSPSSSPIVTEFHNSHRTMTGVVIRDGSNAQYVLTNPGPAGTVVQGEIIYWVAYVSSTHVLAELPANTKYKVTYIGNSTAGTIVISQNAAGNFTTSPNGVLTFSLSATGQLAP
jgi:hypothetical protein